MSEPEPAPEPTEPETQQTTLRRAPRLGVFLIAGAIFGALATLILTSLFPADEKVGFAALYGYFLVYGIPLGVLIGALIGLAFDRRSTRKARTVTVEHQQVD